MMLHILLKKTAGLEAISARILKHSFRVITCTAAMSLVYLAMPALVKADPPGGTDGWTMSFQDNFDSSLDPNNWNTTFWWGNGYIGDGSINFFSPNNILSSNGYLNLEVNNNSEGGLAYTGAVINTYTKFYQTYGYFEARLKVPNGLGISDDFALSPEDTSWPPEVNIMEVPGARSNNATTVWMVNHYLDANGQVSVDNSYSTWTASTGLDQDYHTYGLLWQPGLLVWYVDNVERYRSTVGVPNKPCYIVLSVGVRNDYGSWAGDPTNTTFPQYLSIDWVKAWTSSNSNTQ